MQGLADLLAPVTVEDFFENYWSQKSLLIPGGPEKVAGLFGWEEVNRIFSEHRLDTSQARLAHEGKSAEDLAFLKSRVSSQGNRFFEPDIPLLYRLLREGASLVLDAVDEMSPSVREFCERVGRDLTCQISVNAYSTWRTVPGFGVHWDDHDLFVVQVSGRKHWRLFGKTRPFPLAVDVAENPAPSEGDVEWEAVISPGDVIYVPRGHWHGATGMDEATLHLTCGFSNPTSEDILKWVADQLKDHELFRQDVPRFASSAEQVRYWEEVQRGVAEFLTQASVNDYLNFWKSRNKPRPQFSFPFIGGDTLHQGTSYRYAGVSQSELDEIDGKVIFSAAGKKISVHKTARPVVELLLSGEPFQINDVEKAIAGTMPTEAVAKLLSVLVEHGLAYAVAPRHATSRGSADETRQSNEDESAAP